MAVPTATVGKRTLVEQAYGSATTVAPHASASRSPILQRKFAAGARVRGAEEAHGSPPSPRSGGEPLSPGVREAMERAFGTNLGDVRVHQGSHVSALGARAYTQGTAIHFAPGQYAPETAAGRELVAHELAHVVQARRSGGDATARRSGLSRSTDAAEVEATAAARAVVEGRRPHIQAAPDAELHAAFARLPGGHDPIPPGAKVEFDEQRYPIVDGALPYEQMEVTYDGKAYTIDGRTLILDETEESADAPPPEPEPDPEKPFWKHVQAAARHLIETSFRATGEQNVAPVAPWQVGTAQPLVNTLHVDVGQNDPSAALDALIAHIDEVLVDCAEFVDLVRIRAIQTRIGPEKFNRWIRLAAAKQIGQLRGKLVIRGHQTTGLLPTGVAFSRESASEPLSSTAHAPVAASDVYKLLAKLPAGTRVAWHDSNPESVGSDFENENTIKVGPDQYANAGLPVRVASARETELLLAGVGSGSEDPSVRSDYANKWIFVKEIDVMQVP